MQPPNLDKDSQQWNKLRTLLETEHYITKPDEDLNCIICSKILALPVQTNCGHVFCKPCLEQWISKQVFHIAQCPIDRQPLQKGGYFLDRKTERQIFNLEVRCPNDPHWKGSIAELIRHMETCELEKMTCQCGLVYIRKEEIEHKTNICDLRSVICEICKIIYPLRNKESHKKFYCTYTSCPNNCSETILRVGVESHRNICPEQLVPCTFATVGCLEKLPRKSLKEHMDTSTNNHLLMLANQNVMLLQKINKLEQYNYFHNDLSSNVWECLISPTKEDSTVVFGFEINLTFNGDEVSGYCIPNSGKEAYDFEISGNITREPLKIKSRNLLVNGKFGCWCVRYNGVDELRGYWEKDCYPPPFLSGILNGMYVTAAGGNILCKKIPRQDLDLSYGSSSDEENEEEKEKNEEQGRGRGGRGRGRWRGRGRGRGKWRGRGGPPKDE